MSLEQVQQQLTSHIRNPAECAGPEGIEQRRLKIYRELFYNNIEGFVSGAFPVLRKITADDAWHAMIRDFMVHHQCHTPYFMEISQEFLLYLQNQREPQPNDPAFMLELAHYEWVELGLDIAEQDLTELHVDPEGDLLQQLPVVSPLAWSLVYQYPVHKIGPSFQPEQPGEQPTYLVVYRNRTDHVGFMEANAVTARLLELLQGAAAQSGEQVLLQIAEEMQHPNPQQIIEAGLEIMNQLCGLDIILGTAISNNVKPEK